MLDDGNVYNWFASPFIVKLSLVAALALGAFVLWQFITAAPLVQFRLLRRRNFGLGTLGNFLLGFALYGSAYLLPQYLAVAGDTFERIAGLFKASTPSRLARSWPGPDCRSSW